jgi:hypothetical protein
MRLNLQAVRRTDPVESPEISVRAILRSLQRTEARFPYAAIGPPRSLGGVERERELR